MAAPGRINLIGEHTDYAGGLCLPAAVDRYIAVALRRAAASVRVVSDAYDGVVECGTMDLRPGDSWADLTLGVVGELRGAGLLDDGADIAIASSLPPGAGLSSSAATGVAVAAASLAATGRSILATAVAQLCQRAERNFLGVPSGLMDETAALLGRAGHALLFDPELEEVTPIAVPPEAAWLVCESGVTRELRGSGYADRTAEAETALELARTRTPSLDRLGDLSPGDVEKLELPEPLHRRARHIASEVMRVRMAVASLDAGNLDALGELMLTSHRSLARDCEVSTPELDELVEVAVAAGALGARLMGAGFGGSVLALARAGEAAAVEGRIRRRYRPAAGGEPRTHRVELVDGVMALAG